ncbi:FAD-binding domain-containing protein [Favolaschia claudopus]|uniref:FAD-binding domain-containing protein n=1 Tax=Favolaschia claudopus TaxID=2862362 RepID=A0AAW0E2A5_9AGAR
MAKLSAVNLALRLVLPCFLGSFFILAITPIAGSSRSPLSAITPDAWTSLNASIGGRLRRATPFALPCFAKYNNVTVPVDEVACKTIQDHYTSPSSRVENFSTNMLVQYETCMAQHTGCLLDYTNPQNPLATDGVSCDQGQISPYYVDIRAPSDIQAAFQFAEKTSVPLSIKNTGHDYMGRSRQLNSLGLWTHNLQTMSYHAQFTPEHCKTSHRAITVGAGVTFEQVYKFADDNDVMFIGGYASTIGASGGWLMGGGHSVLSPVYGLGVDRVLEIKIVTPDGKFRTANACQNSDLFWALRGGGGGTFGVVVESTHLVEPRIPLQAINMTFTPTADNLQEFFEILVNNSASWGGAGWGGHVLPPGGLVYVNPRLSLDEAKQSMAQLSTFSQNYNGTAEIQTFASWYAFFTKFIMEGTIASANTGPLGSRLLPQTLFESESGRTQLVAHLVKRTSELGFPYTPVVTPIAYNYTEGATSLTPAWRTGLWHYSTKATFSYNSSVEQIRAAYSTVHNFVRDELTPLAPDSGAYLNEGDVYESDHEYTYWGPNYERLAAIKAKYDPHRLLDCWKCVGWKGPAEHPCYITL